MYVILEEHRNSLCTTNKETRFINLFLFFTFSNLSLLYIFLSTRDHSFNHINTLFSQHYFLLKCNEPKKNDILSIVNFSFKKTQQKSIRS